MSLRFGRNVKIRVSIGAVARLKKSRLRHNSTIHLDICVPHSFPHSNSGPGSQTLVREPEHHHHKEPPHTLQHVRCHRMHLYTSHRAQTQPSSPSNAYNDPSLNRVPVHTHHHRTTLNAMDLYDQGLRRSKTAAMRAVRQQQAI
jgi:hypothetical protein